MKERRDRVVNKKHFNFTLKGHLVILAYYIGERKLKWIAIKF